MGTRIFLARTLVTGLLVTAAGCGGSSPTSPGGGGGGGSVVVGSTGAVGTVGATITTTAWIRHEATSEKVNLESSIKIIM